LREIGPAPFLTRDEEADLLRRARHADDAAREQLIHAHLRLVVKIAHEFEDWGLALLDLISEGNLGLMKAVDRFDPDRGVRLAGYAVWWIKHRMQRAIVNQARTVRLPAHAQDRLLRIRRAARTLHDTLGRDASDAELGAELGLPEHKVARLRAAAQGPASLDCAIDAEGRTLAECVADENALTPSAALEAKSTARQLHDALACLKPRERWVLERRFDLKGDGDRTIAELGRELGVTREGVRVIQNRALKKLRRHVAEPRRRENRLQAFQEVGWPTGVLDSAA
jgi:RNA polymerase primary sigma factor